MAMKEPCFYCGSTASKRAKSKLRGKTITTCTNDRQCERRCGALLAAAPERFNRGR